jgi:hypothetical protein
VSGTGADVPVQCEPDPDLVDQLVAQPALALALTVDGLRALGRATSVPDTAWADADRLRWSLRDGRR